MEDRCECLDVICKYSVDALVTRYKIGRWRKMLELDFSNISVLPCLKSTSSEIDCEIEITYIEGIKVTFLCYRDHLEEVTLDKAFADRILNSNAEDRLLKSLCFFLNVVRYKRSNNQYDKYSDDLICTLLLSDAALFKEYIKLICNRISKQEIGDMQLEMFLSLVEKQKCLYQVMKTDKIPMNNLVLASRSSADKSIRNFIYMVLNGLHASGAKPYINKFNPDELCSWIQQQILGIYGDNTWIEEVQYDLKTVSANCTLATSIATEVEELRKVVCGNIGAGRLR